MNDTHGVIAHVELAPQLWSVVFFPLAAAVAAVYFGMTLAGSPEREKKSTVQLLARVAIAGPALSLVTLLFYAYELARHPASSRYFLVHVGNLLRIGQLDANLDFALDPLSATLAVSITAVGVVVAVILAGRAKESSWRVLARVDALVAALLVLVLADNLLFAFLGWGAAGALIASLGRAGTTSAGRARRVAFTTARVADSAFLLAAVVLFWNLGGTFAEGDYIPDLDARFTAISSAPVTGPVGRIAPGAKSYLTLASYPGAVVFADDSHIPLTTGDQAARAPFVRQQVEAGLHTFRVHPGGGLDDSIVAHTRLADGAELSLVVVGATTSFREIRDQLAITDDHGAPWRKDAIMARRAVGSLGAVTLACLLFVLAVAARASAFPFTGDLADDSDAAGFPLAALIQSAAIGSGIYVLARVSFLFELTPAASTVAACLGACTAVIAALAACAATSPARLFAHVATAHFGIALVASGVGSPIAAVSLIVVSSLALTTLGLLAEHTVGSSDAARWAAAGLAAAPIPGLGASYATARAVGAALSSDRLAHVPAIVIGVPTAISLGLIAFAVWKYMYTAYKKDDKRAEKSTKKAATKKDSPTPAPLGARLGLALLAVAIAVGIASETGGLHTLTSDASVLGDWLSPSVPMSTSHESGGLDFIVFALAFGLALAGFAQARARSRVKGGLNLSDGRLGRWQASREAAGSTLARASTAIAERASILARDTDRYVIDGILGAGAGLVRAAAHALELVKGGDRG